MTKCENCDGNGGFKVDSMTLYGIPGGEDWGEMCNECRGTGVAPIGMGGCDVSVTTEAP